VNAANLITTASLAAGFLAVLLAIDGNFGAAAVAVAVAVVLDVLDGLVARHWNLCGPFGRELDSLADLVTFGVAPALMLYMGGLREVAVLGGIACVLFVVAGAWRLARFPLVEAENCFVGLPIPSAGLLAAGLAVIGPAPALAVVAAIALALLMISTLRVPTLFSVLASSPARRPMARVVAAAAGGGRATARRVRRVRPLRSHRRLRPRRRSLRALRSRVRASRHEPETHVTRE
jgi:CDP-diacylglycerol--serine O-phosphatidyltransferase